MYIITSYGILCAFILRLTSANLAITQDASQPLILTPLIEAGKIQEAQEAAEVTDPIFLGVKSYSGYLTVNREYNSNLFFWFFPALNNVKEAPVLLWLQGGPGASSLIGLFVENGPFSLSSDINVTPRKHSWTVNHSVIYIDSPVGTGFSFTDEGGYCRNETIIGGHLYTALLQFFQLFPDLQSNDFYVAGESYAGKYVPAVSYTIHTNNPRTKRKINLKGLAIGNGLCDPETQLKYSEYLYQIGLIDTNAKEKMSKMEEECVKLIRNREWTQAYYMFNNIVMGDILNKDTSFFKNISGFRNNYNYLHAEPNAKYYQQFIQQENVRAAIHVGNVSFGSNTLEVKLNLIEDFMQSVAEWMSELLIHYKVLLYSGQLDIIIAYPLTLNYLKTFKFSAAEEYKTAKRSLWYVDADLAGYVKCAGNLTEVLVRNAGHLVPTDQPEWSLDLITRFTYNLKLVEQC